MHECLTKAPDPNIFIMATVMAPNTVLVALTKSSL